MTEHDSQYLGRTCCNRLAQVGGLVAQAFASAQIEVDTRVSTEQFFAFWDAIGKLSPADVGVRFANEMPVHEYPVSSLAALHSPDIRTALEKTVRYKRLCGLTEVTIEHRANEVSITTTWLHAVRATPLRLVDLVLASQLAMLRHGTGHALAPKRVELMRKRADEPMLERFFGCSIRFEATHDALVLDERSLAMPFVTRNDDLLATLLPGLEARLASLMTHTFLENVRAAVVRRMRGEKPSVEKIARELSMSTRTLQRRLTEHGVSYQIVLDRKNHWRSSWPTCGATGSSGHCDEIQWQPLSGRSEWRRFGA